MLKVVFDTNVYISALITPGGKAEEAYILAVEKKFELHTSIAILTETARKLREKFSWDDREMALAVKHIGGGARVLKPRTRLNILKDGPDNRILECAQEGKADFIVTGDTHLLDLKKYDGIEIVRISELLRMAKKTLHLHLSPLASRCPLFANR